MVHNIVVNLVCQEICTKYVIVHMHKATATCFIIRYSYVDWVSYDLTAVEEYSYVDWVDNQITKDL